MAETVERTLKVLPPDAKEFVANGKTYRIMPTISFERWVDKQRIELELSFGYDTKDIADGLKSAYAQLNKQEFADAAVSIHNMLMGISSINNDRAPAALRMCALFINTPGEDPRSITEAQIQQKINDWKEEGMDMVSFFHLALGCIRDFTAVYSSISQGSSPRKTAGGQPELNDTMSGSKN